MAGIIFNIQKYSVHDGPGIRTVVFLKGCPLTCDWCSNPESQEREIQLKWVKNKCIGAGVCSCCLNVCEESALSVGQNGKVELDWASCSGCLACASTCPSGALSVYGEVKSVEEVIDEVEKDAVFYAQSGGGLTLSGGEPFMQPRFALDLLKEAKRRNINTAVETCGLVDKKVLLEAAGFVDTLMFDIKSMDSSRHKQYTGLGNSKILENYKAVRSSCPDLKVIVRTPIIPGVNDTVEEVQAIIDFIKNDNVGYELLPYHSLGLKKYTSIGKFCRQEDGVLEDRVFEELKAFVSTSFVS